MNPIAYYPATGELLYAAAGVDIEASRKRYVDTFHTNRLETPVEAFRLAQDTPTFPDWMEAQGLTVILKTPPLMRELEGA